MIQKYFYGVVFSVSTALFFLHRTFLTEGGLDVLFASYVVNVVLAVFGYWILQMLRVKHPEKLGFVFMALSGMKFVVFFVFLQPLYNADGQISSTEFGMFFIPYATTTLLETVALVRALNKM